jgi:hypothetical protein
LSPTWSYYTYVRLLLIGIALLFAAAFLWHEFVRLQQRLIRLDPPGAAAPSWSCYKGNVSKLKRIDKLTEMRNGMKQFVAFATAIGAYPLWRQQPVCQHALFCLRCRVASAPCRAVLMPCCAFRRAAYIYIVGVLLQAWDCVSTPAGLLVRLRPRLAARC